MCVFSIFKRHLVFIIIHTIATTSSQKLTVFL